MPGPARRADRPAALAAGVPDPAKPEPDSATAQLPRILLLTPPGSYRTVPYLEAATRLGAILSNVTPEEEESMAAYGMHLGTAFQLTDDMLDYSGDFHDTGKNLGDDLAEGKPTLPLIYAMKTGSKEQSETVSKAIQNGGGEGVLEAVLQVIHETDALGYTRKKAEAESCMATEAISLLPDSNYKECLLQLATFAVARNY